MDLDSVPDAFRPLVERALGLARGDRRAVGLIVNGSVALGQADRYSDLDLVVTYADDAEVDLPAEAHRLVTALGDVLVAFTGEHVGAPSLVIGLLADPVVHVDVKCERVGEQGRRVEDGLVVWQRGTAVDDARAGTEASWPRRDPQWMEDRVWVWLHYAAVKAARGEVLECLDALSLIRGWVLGPLIAAGRGARPAGVRRLETVAPDELPALHATIGGTDPLACLDALLAAADLYARVRPSGVRVRDRAEAAVRTFVAGLRSGVAAR